MHESKRIAHPTTSFNAFYIITVEMDHIDKCRLAHTVIANSFTPTYNNTIEFFIPLLFDRVCFSHYRHSPICRMKSYLHLSIQMFTKCKYESPLITELHQNCF